MPVSSSRILRSSPTPSAPITPIHMTNSGHSVSSADDASDDELQRARPRSRSPQISRDAHFTKMDGKLAASSALDGSRMTRRQLDTSGHKQSKKHGSDHLDPNSALGMGREYWRQLSRSSSPLGLIPIHSQWRQFIHKHEIPRKLLHISIGFVVLGLYLRGKHVIDAARVLFMLLVPITLVDVVRMKYPPLNRFYISVLGAMMRESEAHDKYNGVISYMAGALFVALSCPSDVAILSIVCLSWCDTAASTFGRLFGKYTPKIRKDKSLAGSIAAFAVGVATALLFYGYIARRVPQQWNAGEHSFAFQGRLSLPLNLRHLLGWTEARASIHGTAALVAVSLWSGLLVSLSEAVDLWSLDDNLTIPVLFGTALSASLKACR